MDAIIATHHRTLDQAIEGLREATPYELGFAQFPLPVYIRGLAYLEAKHGTETVAEFQKLE